MTRVALLVGHAASHEVLCAARDLSGAGWETHVATGARRSLAGASRFVRSEHQVRPPHGDLGGFARDVAAAASTCGAEVVVGCGDPELLALSAVRDRLPATVPLAKHPIVLSAVDKLTLTRAAAEVGLAIPRTEPASDRTLAEWRGPAVVKPRLHLDPAVPMSAWITARMTSTPAELRSAVRDVRAAGGDPVVQEVVAGELIALSAVRTAGGQVTALMQQRAINTWPPRTGVSVRAVTVAVDPTLGSKVVALLDRLGWVGMVQLQFLQPESGPPRLLDLNGRPYGSMPLASAAGLPLIVHWLDPQHAASHNQHGGAPAAAQQGVTYSRVATDLRRALTQGGARAVGDVLSTVWAWWGAAHPVADRRDLRPLFRLIRLSGGELARQAARRASPRHRRVASGSAVAIDPAGAVDHAGAGSHE